MKLGVLFFIFGLSVLCVSCGFLLGYHEGDKHALDAMRLIGCQNPDVESFEMREISPEEQKQ